MPIKPNTIYRIIHTSDLFSLAVKQTPIETKLIMKLYKETINTRDLPKTTHFLRTLLPSVLKSMCFNENNYPFSKEVQHTEVGHLFEHILIEYICLLKIQHGVRRAEVSGLTKWNWIVYPHGTFHITVSAGMRDTHIFSDALQKTIVLVNNILQSGNVFEPQKDSYSFEQQYSPVTQLAS